jgi:serine/threonine protein kinase
MAPELAWGKTKEAGPAVDVYALGAILYELLTGQPPFRGQVMDILDQVRFEPPRRPTSLRPDVPPNLELICLKCLAKKPEQRYATAETLAEELRRFQTGKEIQTSPPPAPQEEFESGAANDSSPFTTFSLPSEGGHSSDPEEGGREAPSTTSWSRESGEDSLRFSLPPDSDLLEEVSRDPFGVLYKSRESGAGSLSFSLPPNYELLEEVGRGGLAAVYKCRQRNMGRTVALKVPHPTLAGDSSISERFRIEANVLSRLQHPNIVQVFDFGVHEAQPYVALEFLDGGTLADRLAGQPQPDRQSAEIVQTLAKAMHYVHEHGFVHRNLKPRAVMFAATGTPKIVSFSLVRAPDLGTDNLEREGEIVGTPAYMAPEQAAGRAVTPSADVYALGVILYEMLTGRPPFKGDHAFEIFQQAVEKEPERPRKVNPRAGRRLEAICLKCLQKDPARRQATANELADDLGRYLHGWFR